MTQGFTWKLRRRSAASTESKPLAERERPWHHDLVRTARIHGQLPYVVEGFMEVVEAVRRGHSVLVRREAAEVADGVRVFDEIPPTDTGSPLAAFQRSDRQLVAIVRFDVSTARFVLQDAGSSVGAVELTPKRLQRYLAAPSRHVGVALGA